MRGWRASAVNSKTAFIIDLNGVLCGPRHMAEPALPSVHSGHQSSLSLSVYCDGPGPLCTILQCFMYDCDAFCTIVMLYV